MDLFVGDKVNPEIIKLARENIVSLNGYSTYSVRIEGLAALIKKSYRSIWSETEIRPDILFVSHIPLLSLESLKSFLIDKLDKSISIFDNEADFTKRVGRIFRLNVYQDIFAYSNCVIIACQNHLNDSRFYRYIDIQPYKRG